MTHFARTLLAAISLAPWLGLAACIDPTPETAPAPPATKVYDFSPRPLDTAPIVAPPQGASDKRQLQYLLARAMPPIATCLRGTNHPAGTLDVTLTLALEPASTTIVEDAVVDAFGDPALAACVQTALHAADASMIEARPEPERWTIHAPLVVDANYTGKL